MRRRFLTGASLVLVFSGCAAPPSGGGPDEPTSPAPSVHTASATAAPALDSGMATEPIVWEPCAAPWRCSTVLASNLEYGFHPDGPSLVALGDDGAVGFVFDRVSEDPAWRGLTYLRFDGTSFGELQPLSYRFADTSPLHDVLRRADTGTLHISTLTNNTCAVSAMGVAELVVDEVTGEVLHGARIHPWWRDGVCNDAGMSVLAQHEDELFACWTIHEDRDNIYCDRRDADRFWSQRARPLIRGWAIQDHPALAVAPDGTTLVGWHSDGGGGNHVYLSFWESEAPPLRLNEETPANHLQLAVDPEGRYHALWRANGLWHASCHPADADCTVPAEWTRQQIMATHELLRFVPKLAFGRDGDQILGAVAWMEDDRMWASYTCNSEGWSPPVPVDGSWQEERNAWSKRALMLDDRNRTMNLAFTRGQRDTRNLELVWAQRDYPCGDAMQ